MCIRDSQYIERYSFYHIFCSLSRSAACFGHGKADRGKQLCFTGPSSAPIFSPVPRHGAFFIALYAASCRNTQVNLGQKIYFAMQSEVIAAGLFERQSPSIFEKRRISMRRILKRFTGLFCVLAPVSYTHLDVYKRQVVHRTGHGPERGEEALRRCLYCLFHRNTFFLLTLARGGWRWRSAPAPRPPRTGGPTGE